MKKVIFGLATCFILTSVAFASDVKSVTNPITIKISNVVKIESPKGFASEQFKKMMESKFPGRVKVEIYYNNNLFKYKEETEALELGAVDVIIPSSSKVSSSFNVKEFELFDLPFLFNKAEDITKFTQSSSGDKLLSFLNRKNKNLYAVAYWPNDFKNYIGYKFYKNPGDFNGQVARIDNSGSEKLFYDSLNVKETILIDPELLSNSMKKQGEFKVDVSANSNFNVSQFKLYEKSNFMTLSNHDVSSDIFLTNKRWFNSLPDDIKLGLVESAKQAGLVNFEVTQKNSAQDLAELQKNGVQFYTWTKEERDEFKKKAITVHANYLKNINQEFLNEVYSIVR